MYKLIFCIFLLTQLCYGQTHFVLPTEAKGLQEKLFALHKQYLKKPINKTAIEILNATEEFWNESGIQFKRIHNEKKHPILELTPESPTNKNRLNAFAWGVYKHSQTKVAFAPQLLKNVDALYIPGENRLYLGTINAIELKLTTDPIHEFIHAKNETNSVNGKLNSVFIGWMESSNDVPLSKYIKADDIYGQYHVLDEVVAFTYESRLLAGILSRSEPNSEEYETALYNIRSTLSEATVLSQQTESVFSEVKEIIEDGSKTKLIEYTEPRAGIPIEKSGIWAVIQLDATRSVTLPIPELKHNKLLIQKNISELPKSQKETAKISLLKRINNGITLNQNIYNSLHLAAKDVLKDKPTMSATEWLNATNSALSVIKNEDNPSRKKNSKRK